MPVGLYIHIPWCVKKCPYCDFNSHEVNASSGRGQSLSTELQATYLDCLRRDLGVEVVRWQTLRAANNDCDKPEVQSIFIGGGTPSLCDPDFYDELLYDIRRKLDLHADAEITLEANPGTADSGFFRGYRQAGINRLSMGVQSFNDASLLKLGRIHNSDDVRRAFAMAREAGFQNINLDIMHGLPDQSVAEAMTDLQSAVDMRPEHLSWYQLTIEKNTAFYSKPPLIPQDRTLADIESGGFELLAKNGYEQYEVSAFALDDTRCLHNLNYWGFGDYLAIGAGAHGKITGSDSVFRRWKTRTPKDYMSSEDFLAGEQSVPAEELALEFLMNALRLNDGFTKSAFERRTGIQFESIQKTIDELEVSALLTQSEAHVSLTPLGFRFIDEILSRF